MTEKILYKELSYKVYGLCFETQNELGRFRSEKTYADYLDKLLKRDKIDFCREKCVGSFAEEISNRRNRPDFIVNKQIIVDLKAKDIVTKEDYLQMKRYLTASDIRLGLIINFRQKHIYPKRVLNPHNQPVTQIR